MVIFLDFYALVVDKRVIFDSSGHFLVKMTKKWPLPAHCRPREGGVKVIFRPKMKGGGDDQISGGQEKYLKSGF